MKQLSMPAATAVVLDAAGVCAEIFEAMARPLNRVLCSVVALNICFRSA
jgi:hypothetical protein